MVSVISTVLIPMGGLHCIMLVVKGSLAGQPSFFLLFFFRRGGKKERLVTIDNIPCAELITIQ